MCSGAVFPPKLCFAVDKADRRADFVDVLPEMWYNLLNSAQTAQEKRKGYSMKIVLVGGGKVGTALARQLSEEGHNVTVIDTNKARVEHIGESYDVMSILGNGSSITTLSEAYLRRCRVQYAEQLLFTTDLSILEIAQRVGYDSPSRFAAMFKREKGITPVRED